jgi:hypothetical protein
VIDRFCLRMPYLGSLMRMYATGQLSPHAVGAAVGRACRW